MEKEAYFSRQSDVVRTKFRNDIDTIRHELGHALDKKLGLIDSVPGNARQELMTIGAGQAEHAPALHGKNYSEERTQKEGIADYDRMYFRDRSGAAFLLSQP